MPSPKAWDILHNEALSRGLIGHWKLNAQTGASVNIAQDSGPNGLHGLVEAFNRSTGNPIPLPTIVSGKIRSAYDFEAGVSSTEHQRVNLSNNILVRPANISISAWVWLDDDGTHRADDFIAEIVSNYRAEDSPSNGFLLRHRAPTPYRWQFNIFAGSPSTVGLAQADHTPTFNTWYHTVGTYDGVYVRVYANGVLLNTLLHPLGGDINYGTGPDVETWIAGYMGSTYLSGQVGVARGRIDEVTMWDRGLEPGEVAHLYNAGAGRFFDMKTAGWWDFNGTDAALRMDGKDAHVFDPADNTNDFTALGMIEPDAFAAVGQGDGIMMKWDNVAVVRCWALYLSQNLGILAASVTDGTSTSSAVSTTNLVIGDENFVGMRYEYSGTPGTSSDLDVYCRDNKESISNAAGPINNPTDVDMQIADGDNTAYDSFFDGKIYWLAYWNRKLTDQEVEDVRTGAVHPANLAPDFYWDGHQAVAGTYISERPDDPRYWEFDVEGTPTKGGSSEPTLPVPVGNCALRAYPRDMVEMVAAADPLDAYYTFPDEEVRMVVWGSQPENALFNPGSNAFSVVMLVEKVSLVAGWDFIHAYKDGGAADHNWFLQTHTNNTRLRARVSGDGSAWTDADVASVLGSNTKTLVALTCVPGTSLRVIQIVNGVTQATLNNTTAIPASIFASTAPMSIGGDEFEAHTGMRVYWYAYYEGGALTESVLQQLSLNTGALHPLDDTIRPFAVAYTDFHAGVQPSGVRSYFDYPSPQGSDAIRLYFKLKPGGTSVITRGGTDFRPSWPFALPAHQTTMAFRTTQQKAGAQLLGRVNVSETNDSAPTLFHRTTAQRAGSLLRGLVSLLRFSRKRGR